ncbi:hypothetical protein H8Z60_10495 [Mycolicibacterium fortuitum]|jgi:hypothetical protein|nr:hypothetical protein [Mycolicibacterium fortuitum]
MSRGNVAALAGCWQPSWIGLANQECRADFGADDLATLMWAMSKVIAMAAGDDGIWRRHLGFVLDGLRAR